jgi:hypothetical protein
MRLFLTAFVQVFLVAMNTIFLAKSIWVGVTIASFGISFTWTLNVGRVAVGTWGDRFVYSFGAMCGSLTGLLITKWIL